MYNDNKMTQNADHVYKHNTFLVIRFQFAFYLARKL
jgi:hypothetical protein